MEQLMLPSEIERMAANLNQLKSQFTQQSSSGHEYSPTPQKNNNGYISVEQLQNQYQLYLSNRRLPVDHEQKMELLLNQQPSVGSAIALYEMLHYFREALDGQILRQIHNKYTMALKICNSRLQMQSYGQLLSLCGCEDEQLCQFIIESIVQKLIQVDLGMIILTNQGYTGFTYVIKLAEWDNEEISPKIIQFLCSTETVLQSVIIPSLIQDTQDYSKPKNTDIALSALNRLGPILKPHHVDYLFKLMQHPSIDKTLLFSTIRSSGKYGQQKIINLLQHKYLPQPLITLALQVLSWRIPKKYCLRIRSISFTLQSCLLPGKLYQYNGSVGQWNFRQLFCPDTLCIDARQLLVKLYEVIHNQNLQGNRNGQSFSLLRQCLQLNNQQQLNISSQVIQILTQTLKHKKQKIRQTVLLELGNIGSPQACQASQKIAKSLWDNDSSVRSVACWTLSRLNEPVSKKIQNRLVQLMKDNYWKVRTSAAITLGVVGAPLNTTLQGLLKALQDGTISKSTLCQTIVKLGGQQIALQLLKTSCKTDFKLRQAVISSFSFCNIDSPHLGLIIQELIKNSRQSRIQTRELCLLTITNLKSKVQKSNQHVSYLQTRHLLPLFYCFLDDPSPKIRKIASESIMSLGSQSELVFIQGVTKGSVMARIQCIKCLGVLGVQNFRAIVLGLRDENEKVRKITGQTILKCFRVEDVIQEYKDKQKNSISLVCNLKQALLRTRDKQLKYMLQQIIERLGINKQNKNRNN